MNIIAIIRQTSADSRQNRILRQSRLRSGIQDSPAVS